MQILPIDYKYTNSINSNKSFHGNITKNSLKSKTLKETAEKTSVQAATAIITLSGIDKLLRNRGITHCSSYGNQIDIASGYNGGFYTITVPVIMPTSEAKEYLECNFNKGQGAFGGVQNYMAMVKDIKRQDIVRKGLRVHTYDINNNISERQKDIANTYLSRILDKNIELNDMFFIDNEAFYYDKAEKTAYSILLYDELSGAIKPKLKTCKFTVGDNGDTIGYSVTEWNNYKMDYMQSSYIEQQKPSTKLKAIAEPDNKRVCRGFQIW